MALALALEHPPAGLVLMSTFTSIHTWRGVIARSFRRPWSPTPTPSLRRVRDLRAPLLVIHGDRDEMVPVLHAEALHEAAPDPKRLHVH